jgi:hypothetical protein
MILFVSAKRKAVLNCVSLLFDSWSPFIWSLGNLTGTVHVYPLGNKMVFICFLVESSGSGALSHSIKSPSTTNFLFHSQKKWGSFRMPPWAMWFYHFLFSLNLVHLKSTLLMGLYYHISGHAWPRIHHSYFNLYTVLVYGIFYVLLQWIMKWYRHCFTLTDSSALPERSGSSPHTLQVACRS